MDVTQLRIGNFINNNVECTQVTKSDLQFFLVGDNQHYANPVSLNESWLVEFGFQRTNVPIKSNMEYIDYRMGQFVLFILPKGIVEVEFCAAHNKIEDRGYLCSVKYVHQLQNLCFALTGEELVIKSND